MSILDQLFLNSGFKLIDIIEDSADIYLNGRQATLKELSVLVDNIRQGLGHKQVLINGQTVQDSIAFYSWELIGLHEGVLFDYLPTRKQHKIAGQLSYRMGLQEKIQTLMLSFDKAAVLDQLTAVSDKAYALSDFNMAGFSEDTLAFFEKMLHAQQPPCNINQQFVNLFRRSLLKSGGELPEEMKQYYASLQEKVCCTEVMLPIEGRAVRALYYVPKHYLPQKNDRLTLYFHGGGWVMLPPEFYDAQSREICAASQTPLLCIDYRLAPENPFPAGFDDCYNTYRWLTTADTRELLKQGFNHIILGGDSAGGALAGGVIHKAFANRLKAPMKLLLLSPVTDMVFEDYDYFNERAFNDFFISNAMASCQRGIYLPYRYWRDPYFSPIHGDLSHFPNTLMALGAGDPLVGENKAFAKKLKEQSAATVIEIIETGYTHDYQLFIPLAAVSRSLYAKIGEFMRG